MSLRGASLATGWGAGLDCLPHQVQAATAGRRIIPLPATSLDDERVRRATRECVLAIQAVERAIDQSSLSAPDLAGQRTALVYASASSYIAANWEFLHADTSSVMYFPYTAPSAVPGEVGMRFHITGPYLSFLSGANAGLEALWQASRLLVNNQCDRALVVSVETFAECEALFAAGRRWLSFPLVESALCLILEAHPLWAQVGFDSGHSTNLLLPSSLETQLTRLSVGPRSGAVSLYWPTTSQGHRVTRQLRDGWPLLPITCVNQRTGNCLAATPLIGLLLALADNQYEQILCLSHWGNAWSMLSWPHTLSRLRSSRGLE